MQLKTVVSILAGLFLLTYIILDIPFTVGYFVLAGLFTVLAFMPEKEMGKYSRLVRGMYGLFAAVWLMLALLNMFG